MRWSAAVLILLLSVLDIFVAASIEEIQTQIVQAVELAHDIRESQANAFNCTELATFFKVFMNSFEDVDTRPNITLERLFERQRLFRDCSDVYENGYEASGVYPIWLQRGYRFSLFYCDMETVSEVSNKTGWTVIQKRMNGEINFEKNWDKYVTGFGNITGEHWVGLENIYSITSQLLYRQLEQNAEKPGPRLRIDFEDWDGFRAFTEFDNFIINGPTFKYKISFVGNVFGTTQTHDSPPPIGYNAFSAVGKDSTKQKCPKQMRGGWWFDDRCGPANLNGPYAKSKTTMDENNIYWSNWTHVNQRNTALRRVSMKIQY